MVALGSTTFSFSSLAVTLTLSRGATATTAVNDRNELVAPGDIVGQTRYILEKFGKLLSAAGGDFSHVVETTDYITTRENYGGTAAVRREFFRPPYPVATGVIVAGLLREGALIEISAVAILPDPSMKKQS